MVFGMIMNLQCVQAEVLRAMRGSNCISQRRPLAKMREVRRLLLSPDRPRHHRARLLRALDSPWPQCQVGPRPILALGIFAASDC